jgi:hypothetical protein
LPPTPNHLLFLSQQYSYFILSDYFTNDEIITPGLFHQTSETASSILESCTP